MPPDQNKKFGERNLQPLNEEALLKEMADSQPPTPPAAEPGVTPTEIPPFSAPVQPPTPILPPLVPVASVIPEQLPNTTKWWLKGIIGAAIALGGTILLDIVSSLINTAITAIYSANPHFGVNTGILADIATLILFSMIARVALGTINFVNHKLTFALGVFILSYGLAQVVITTQVILFGNQPTFIISPIYLYVILFGFLTALLFLLFVDRLTTKLPEIVVLCIVLVIAYIPYTQLSALDSAEVSAVNSHAQHTSQELADANPNWPALPTGNVSGFSTDSTLCNKDFSWTEVGSATCVLSCPYSVMPSPNQTFCISVTYTSGPNESYLKPLLYTSDDSCDIDQLAKLLTYNYGYDPSGQQTVQPVPGRCESLTTPGGRTLIHEIETGDGMLTMQQMYYFILNGAVTVLEVDYPSAYNQTDQTQQPAWMKSFMQYVDSFQIFQNQRKPITSTAS